MGIPSSPLQAPAASALLKLKQLSPELPLLQAVEEIGNGGQASELLPPASVDLKDSFGRAAVSICKQNWEDAKRSESTDSGDEHDNQSKSSQDLQRSESVESVGNTLEAATLRPSPAADDILQDKGVMKMDVSTLVPFQEMGMAAAGFLTQLLCEVWRDGQGGMSIVPCAGDDLAVDCEHEVFWCYVTFQEDGSTLLTPCTDAQSCGVLEDANGVALDSESDVVGAPVRPPLGSHVPMWVYGAQWPYCVAPTTMILSSLPDELLQEDLVEILDKEGFSGFYDFLYLPREAGRSLGYAIVNLTRHEHGLALSARMHGRTSWCGANTSECQVTWSMPLQGVTALTAHYRNHPACHEDVPLEMRPTFFSGGWPRAFPPAPAELR